MSLILMKHLSFSFFSQFVAQLINVTFRIWLFHVCVCVPPKWARCVTQVLPTTGDCSPALLLLRCVWLGMLTGYCSCSTLWPKTKNIHIKTVWGSTVAGGLKTRCWGTLTLNSHSVLQFDLIWPDETNSEELYLFFKLLIEKHILLIDFCCCYF